MDILIAEDSPISLSFLKKVLESWGHKVTECQNGKEAWDNIVKEGSPKILVLDWEMPEISGIELTRKIRKTSLDKYIIVLTAKDDAAEIKEAIEAGVNDYICKPFRHEELELRIKAAVTIATLEEQLQKLNQ